MSRAQPTPEALARAVASDLSAGHFDKVAAQFNAQMAAALSEARLATTWDQVSAQLGKLKQVTAARTEAIAGGQRVVLTCEFDTTTAYITIAFDRESKIAGLTITPTAPPPIASWTPPSYIDAARFDERDLTIGDPSTPLRAGVQLPGTLSTPKGAGPFPAVVLVHGSGPGDRDETLGPSKPFKDLAGGLAARGVAVLRYDKRTLRLPNLFQGKLYTVKDEYLDDIQAAVTLLAGTPSIDARRIVVVGHSEGGLLAPRIAAGDARVKGAVILAGAARPIEELALEQIRYLTGNDRTMVAAMEASARQIQSPDLKPDTMVDFLSAKIPGSYWLDLRGYHPVEVAASLKIPLLIMQGQRDYQVTMTDFDLWSHGLSGHANVTLKTFPALNHLFIAGEGPSKPDEYLQPGHVSEDVIRTIADWVLTLK